MISNCPACCVLWVPSGKPRTSPKRDPHLSRLKISSGSSSLGFSSEIYTVVLYFVQSFLCLLWDGLFHTITHELLTEKNYTIIRIFEQGRSRRWLPHRSPLSNNTTLPCSLLSFWNFGLNSTQTTGAHASSTCWKRLFTHLCCYGPTVPVPSLSQHPSWFMEITCLMSFFSG